MKKIYKFFLCNYLAIIAVFLCTIFSIMIIKVYAKAAGYSILTLDDFIHYSLEISRLEGFSKTNIFLNSLKYALWDCEYLGGRYFTMFCQSIFGPMPNHDILIKEKIVMVVFNITYFISLYFVIASFIINVLAYNSKKLTKLLYISITYLVVIMLLNCTNYYLEVYTWFSGAVAYLVPLSMLFFSIGCLFFSLKQNSIIWGYLTIIFGFFALGGNICIVTVAFSLIFPIFLYTLIRKKLNTINIIIFIQYLLFALLNVMAPGNFNRRGAMFQHVNEIDKLDFDYIELFNGTIKFFYLELENYIKNSFSCMLAIIIAIIIVYILLKEKITIDKVLLVGFWNLISWFAILLIFFIGHEDFSLLSNRCRFIIDPTIILSLISAMVTIVYLILYLFSHIELNKKICFLILLIFIASSNFVFNKNVDKSFSNIPLIKINEELNNGKYDNYYNVYSKMIMDMEKNMNSKYIEVVEPSDDMCPLYLNNFVDGGNPYYFSNDIYIGGFFNIDKIAYKKYKNKS